MGSGIRWGEYQHKHSPEGLHCVQLERGPTRAQGMWHGIALKARNRAEATFPITVELPPALSCTARPQLGRMPHSFKA